MLLEWANSRSVVQDAWTRIRSEHLQQIDATSTEEDMAELARATQMQLRNIVQDCTDSVLQLRLSINDDLDAMRSSIETFQEQLEAMERGSASQRHECSASADAVTPGILAAAVAAIERLVKEYLP
jgi:hypothetical protein